MFRHFACFALLILSTVWAGIATAQLDSQPLASHSATLDGVEAALEKTASASPEQVKRWLRAVTPIMDAADGCIGDTRLDLERVQGQLRTLGEPVEGEDPDIAEIRQRLKKRKAELQRRVARCRLLLLRSDNLLDSIGKVQQERLTRHLFRRGPAVNVLAYEQWLQPSFWIETVRAFVVNHSGIERLSPPQWAYLLGLVFAGAVAAGVLRTRLGARLANRPAGSFSGRFSHALGTVYVHYLPHFIASVTAAIALHFIAYDGESLPFLNLIAYGLPGYFLLLTLIHVFVAPFRPEDRFVDIEDELAHALSGRLRVLALLIFFGYLLFAALSMGQLPEMGLLTARTFYAGILVLNLIWVLWLLGQVPRLENLSWFRVALSAVLLGALAAEWLGYRNLSVFVVGSVFGTLLAFGLFLLVGELLSDFFDGLDNGTRQWHRQIRRFIGLQPSGPIRGLAWLRALTSIAVWVAFALLLLRIWGLSDSGFERLRAYIADGITVGSLTVVPARVAVALLVLAVMLAVSGWFRTRLERSWLSKTRMDRGAREALVTISGYVGVGIAVLMGLAVAGVDFGSLAIIAGALSVGIGFGLQNIVNNFVSGLILLFERPVKTGDWVVVGPTQGYVKRISIRSTHIQTFDQADVIVPNSDLVSNQVTNWMLRDPRGRIKVPVHVAYGSDTEKVRELMLQVALEHPLVVANEPLLEPRVLFNGYGESALQFELRCFIHYIDEMVVVSSDLYFAIDKTFRKHGIHIPYPQRDIHIRDVRDVPPANDSPETGPE